jgi:transcriptional regulator with XRE-family HTH domain
LTSVHDPEYRRIIKKLRDARKAAGLSQAQAGKALGKPHSFVSKCEQGERRIDVLELMRFARLYGRKLRDFVEG